MFKFNAGRIDSRQAVLIGFGFEYANLDRIKDDDPVLICGKDIEIAGANFVVFSAGDEGQKSLQENLSQVVENIVKKEPEGRIPVASMTDFYVAFLSLGENDTCYAIGLTPQAMAKMKQGQTYKYRVRHVEGNDESTNYEVLLFAGENNATMEEAFQEVIGPETRRK